MTNSELMHAAFVAGVTDDAHTSGWLDAIRDESGCTLMAAVLEVARVWNALAESRELAQATALMAKGSEWKDTLLSAAMAECDIPTGAAVTVFTVAGNQWPRYTDHSIFTDGDWAVGGTLTVGARWLLNEQSAQKEAAAVGADAVAEVDDGSEDD